MGKVPELGDAPCKIEKKHTWQLSSHVSLSNVLSWPQRALNKPQSWTGVTDCGSSSNSVPVVSTPPISHVYVTRLAPKGNVFARL